jgi:hypothetical protein
MCPRPAAALVCVLFSAAWVHKALLWACGHEYIFFVSLARLEEARL